MKKNFFYTSIILFIFFTTHAWIIETDNLELILRSVDANTLVIFDIDNTVARPEGELGSDEWFCYLVDQKIAQGYDKASAMYAVLPLCYYAQFNLPLILTDPIIPTLLKNLTAHGIYSMGLTSRGPYLAERTYEQLINIDINFWMPPIKTDEIVLSSQYPFLYKYNIIFAGSNDKGNALLLFLDTIDYHPSSIIFVDDKMFHVQSVEKAAISRNINYIGIRYSGCDKYINNFDPAKAALQLQMLQQQNREPQYKSSALTEPIPYWHYPILLLLYILLNM